MNDPRPIVRRFTGPEAHELYILCRPDGTARPALQAEALYRAVASLLADEGASPENVVCEAVYFRDIQSDGDAVIGARARVLGEAIRSSGAVTTLVQQPPLDERISLEVAVLALVPRRSTAGGVARDVRVESRCECPGCSRVRARLVHVADWTSAYTGNIYGLGGNAFDEAYDMFVSAEVLLEAAGMTFGDVVRTWIYVRDIERDYAALNRARREFLRQRGIDLLPASTGVGGGLLPERHNFSINLYAARSPRPMEIGRMSAPSLNEAPDYGADFSRGLKVVEANRVALYVSGTASVDEAGRTVHPGDFVAQVDRMLMNISSLLAAQDASFRNVVSAVTYVKYPKDGARLRSLFRDRGFGGFPTVLVEAPLCRADLLCETEVVAALPLSQATTP
ncbi:hypothetical protein L6Q96_08380 [Candidatus Binatia bacterium]|nr:hypothetical protein [Candidatus Binatia bacterium]